MSRRRAAWLKHGERFNGEKNNNGSEGGGGGGGDSGKP
jgi:hypothetical protein